MISSDKLCLVIKVREIRIVKEVKRSDSLWGFACGDVLSFTEINWVGLLIKDWMVPENLLRWTELLGKMLSYKMWLDGRCSSNLPKCPFSKSTTWPDKGMICKIYCIFSNNAANILCINTWNISNSEFFFDSWQCLQ